MWVVPHKSTFKHKARSETLQGKKMAHFSKVNPKEKKARSRFLAELNSVGIRPSTPPFNDPHYWVPAVELVMDKLSTPIRFLRFRDGIAIMGPHLTSTPIVKFCKQLPENDGHYYDGGIVRFSRRSHLLEFLSILQNILSSTHNAEGAMYPAWETSLTLAHQQGKK